MSFIKKPMWWNANLGLALLRIAIGVTFLAHGIAKLGNMEGTIGFFGMLGLPAALAWAVALIETLGGAAVLVGFWTAPAGILLAAVMVGAIATAKWGKPFMGGYEFELVLLLASLALSATGPGAWAVSRKAKATDAAAPMDASRAM